MTSASSSLLLPLVPLGEHPLCEQMVSSAIVTTTIGSIQDLRWYRICCLGLDKTNPGSVVIVPSTDICPRSMRRFQPNSEKALRLLLVCEVAKKDKRVKELVIVDDLGSGGTRPQS